MNASITFARHRFCNFLEYITMVIPIFTLRQANCFCMAPPYGLIDPLPYFTKEGAPDELMYIFVVQIVNINSFIIHY